MSHDLPSPNCYMLDAHPMYYITAATDKNQRLSIQHEQRSHNEDTSILLSHQLD